MVKLEEGCRARYSRFVVCMPPFHMIGTSLPTSADVSCCLSPLQEVAEKEAIAGELAAAEPRLLQTHRGPLLLRR